MKIGMPLTGDRIVIRDYAPEDVWFDSLIYRKVLK